MNTIEQEAQDYAEFKCPYPKEIEGTEAFKTYLKDRYERTKMRVDEDRMLVNSTYKAALEKHLKPQEPVPQIEHDFKLIEAFIHDANIQSEIVGAQIEAWLQHNAPLYASPVEQPKPAPDELELNMAKAVDIIYADGDGEIVNKAKAAQACAAIAQSHTEAAVKSEAIGFAEWVDQSEWTQFDEAMWLSQRSSVRQERTTRQLYDLYQASKTK